MHVTLESKQYLRVYIKALSLCRPNAHKYATNFLCIGFLYLQWFCFFSVLFWISGVSHSEYILYNCEPSIFVFVVNVLLRCIDLGGIDFWNTIGRKVIRYWCGTEVDPQVTARDILTVDTTQTDWWWSCIKISPIPLSCVNRARS